MVVVKIHRSYRNVVAVCDSELIGKKFEEGIRQIDITEFFFRGKEMHREEAVKFMRAQSQEDATFNIVGHQAVEAALEAEIIGKNGISHIQGIPFALVLV